LELCLGGLSPPKPPRGDGTGPQANPLMRTHLALLRGKNGKALSRKWRYRRSLKDGQWTICNSLLECATITALDVILSTQNRSMTRNCWNRAWLAGSRLLISPGEPTKNVTGYIFDETYGLR